MQLVEELADLAEPEVVDPSREVAIGLTMRQAGPDGWLILHQPPCAGRHGCTCTPHAIRSQGGQA